MGRKESDTNEWLTFIMNKSTFLSSLTNHRCSNHICLFLLLNWLFCLKHPSHLLACQMHFGSHLRSNLNFSCSGISNKSSKLVILGFHAISFCLYSYTCHFHVFFFFCFNSESPLGLSSLKVLAITYAIGLTW